MRLAFPSPHLTAQVEKFLMQREYQTEKCQEPTRTLSYIGAGILFTMMLLTTLDVFFRYLFNSPILGGLELTEFMLVIVVFFSLPYTQCKKSHVSVDFIMNLLPKNIQSFSDLMNLCIAFALLLAISFMNCIRGFEVIKSHETSGILSIPVYPFIFVVALGSLAMGIEILRDIVHILKKKSEGK